MGFVGDFFATTVLRYKVESKEAIRDIQNLSKEQKKAAKEASVALKEQGEYAAGMGEKYAKTAAVIGGAYLLAKNGLEALKKESRLAVGSVGVDIEKLDAAAGGLRTRWELMSIAQAGSRGAFKLTTQQIGYVVEGMRAFEKQGFESTEVQNELTKALTEGKLEGLDKFGLSLKSTGDRSKDTQTLLRALRDEVREVGGNFDKAGDAAERSAVTIQNILNKIRVWLGQATQKSLDFAESIGKWAGKQVYGELSDGAHRDTPEFLDDSARRFALARRSDPAGHNRSLLQVHQGRLDQLSGFDAKGIEFSATDRAASAQAEAFVRDIRSGVYKTLGPEALAGAVAKLPQAWELARPDLRRMVDDQFTYLEKEWTGRAVNMARELADSFRVAYGDMQADVKAGRKKKGGQRRDAGYRDPISWDGFGVAGASMYDFDPAAEKIARGEAWRQSLQDDARAKLVTGTGYDHRSSAGDREGDADLIRSIDESMQSMEGGDTWLAKILGPVDEFDLYTEALTTLGSTVTNVGDQIYRTWADGGELTSKAIRKMIGAEIAAEGQKLWARGVAGVLTGLFHIATLDPRGPGEVATGGAMIAGATALGALARTMGGGGSTPGGASAGARGASQDHRGGNGGTVERAGSSAVILVGGISDFDSDRYKEERIRDGMRRAGSYAPPRGAGQA